MILFPPCLISQIDWHPLIFVHDGLEWWNKIGVDMLLKIETFQERSELQLPQQIVCWGELQADEALDWTKGALKPKLSVATKSIRGSNTMLDKVDGLTMTEVDGGSEDDPMEEEMESAIGRDETQKKEIGEGKFGGKCCVNWLTHKVVNGSE